jgi:beta-lactamase regulating signal transducer with metallopeptidase domain
MWIIDSLNQFTSWLLMVSIKSLPLIALILLIQFLLKRYLTAAARFGLWASLLIGLSIPFGWSFYYQSENHLSEHNIAKTQLVFDQAENNSTTIIGETQNNSTSNSTHPISPTSIHTMLSLVWLVVFLSMLAVTTIKIRQLLNITRLAKPANKIQLEQLQNAKQIMGYRNSIDLFYSNQIESPFTFGFLTPRILFPEDISSKLSSGQINHVMLHEVAHIKRLDILWNWISYFLCSVYWFNPAIWWAMGRVKNDMEMACDATVLKQLQPVNHSQYGLTLIEASQFFLKTPKMSLGVLDNYRDLKNRISMIKEFSVMNFRKSFLFVLILSALTLSALAQPETDKDTKSPPAETNSADIISLLDFARYAEKDLGVAVLVGQNFATTKIPKNLNSSKLNYGQLLTQLKINGFTAYKNKDYVQIIPIPDARSYAIPTIEKGKTYFEDEYVTDYIKIEKACAGSILVAIRPMVPRDAHMTVLESANTVIISDFYQNIQRVRAAIALLEANVETPKKCN